MLSLRNVDWGAIGATAKEWIDYGKKLAIGGAIFWWMLLTALQLSGVVDVKARCGSLCTDLPKLIIGDALGAPGDHRSTWDPLTIDLTFFPVRPT